MADPVTMTMLATAASVAGTATSAISSYQASNAQAEQAQQAAAANAEFAKRKQNESLSSAQDAASQELARARMAQSKLTTMAGASGSGVDDPTIRTLHGDLEQAGQTNAARAMAEGEQRRSDIDYQSQLERWQADSQSRITKAGAKATLLGGILKATGDGLGGYGKMKTNMGARYGGWNTTVHRTGYGLS